MGTKLMPQSPSSIGVYKTCPRQYEAKYITKEVTFVESEQIRFGNRMHAAAQHYVSSGVSLPDEFAHMKGFLDVIAAWPNVLTELTLAVDENFRSCGWRDRWVGGKIDVTSVQADRGVAWLNDYKTGKPKKTVDPLQLQINAVCIFAEFPQVNKVISAYSYTQTGDVEKFTMDRENLPRIHKSLKMEIQRIKHAHESGTFVPSPNGLCKAWCDVRRCEFNKREDWND